MYPKVCNGASVFLPNAGFHSNTSISVLETGVREECRGGWRRSKQGINPIPLYSCSLVRTRRRASNNMKFWSTLSFFSIYFNQAVLCTVRTFFLVDKPMNKEGRRILPSSECLHILRHTLQTQILQFSENKNSKPAMFSMGESKITLIKVYTLHIKSPL